jgi:ribonucleoside-diphosphate reductase alpha chain
MLEVIARHRDAARRLPTDGVSADLRQQAIAVWSAALKLGTRSGYRNAQVTAIAPTGTTHRMMDCTTPGVEPSGGGLDTSPEDQLRMIAAVQPFLSGGVAKRIVLPPDVAPEEIQRLFMQAWRAGLKSLAVVRQPPDQAQQTVAAAVDALVDPSLGIVDRRRLPAQANSLTHRFSVAGQEGFVTVGLYEDGTPGEMSISMSASGSALAGFLDAFASGVTATLQNGVPLESLVRSFARARPDQACWSSNPHVPRAESVVDHVLRWMATQFLPADRLEAVGVAALDADFADPGDATLELN